MHSSAASHFLTSSCWHRLLNEGQVPFVETVPFRVIAVFTALQFIGLAAVYVVSSWTGVSTGATKKPTLAHCQLCTSGALIWQREMPSALLCGPVDVCYSLGTDVLPRVYMTYMVLFLDGK